MPRRKKRPDELTNAEALRKLFPAPARKKLRREAEKARKDEGKKSTKKDTT
jgi:hypothetical protein